MGQQRVRVLMLDDDEEDYLLTCDLFAEIPGGGFTLDWEPDFARALESVRAAAHDLYLVDYRLGARTGLDFLGEARALGLKAPVIILTGQGQREADLEAMAAGAADFLEKARLEAPLLERSLRYALEQYRHESDLLRGRDELEARVAERTAELARVNDALRDENRERRRSEEALRRSQERLDLVVRSTELGLWLCDLPVERLECNAKFKEHLGLPADGEVTGKAFFERLHPDDRRTAEEAIERTIREGAPYDVTYRAVAPDGRVRWVRAIGGRFDDAEGRPLRFDGVTIDVTEQKRAEEALKEADRRKDEFLAMLSHELRNPLAPLKNALQMIRLAKDPAGETVREAHLIMERQVAHLIRLVDELLDVEGFARGKVKLRRERTPLAPVVARAVEACRPQLDARRHRLELTLPDEPVWLDADPIRLAQVLINLLNNAVKYTPEGGRIALAVTAEPERVCVSVRDNGTGIPPDVLPKVFDLFTQAERTLDRAEGGLGIGLTLVKRITDLHGGTVEARSEGVGKGSEFVICLPRARPPETGMRNEDKPPTRRPALRAAHAQRRVLVVDDNRDSAETMGRLLVMLGHAVHAVHHGSLAVEEAAKYRPEVVLLDIGLPGIDGFEVCRRLRALGETKEALIVAVTGYTQPEDRRRSREVGFDAHLVKPVDLDALQALMSGEGAPDPSALERMS